jgi:hypothetical protein
MASSRTADHFRRATRESVAGSTAEERVERSLALGQLGIDIYASANGLSTADARAVLRRRRDAARARRSRE